MSETLRTVLAPQAAPAGRTYETPAWAASAANSSMAATTILRREPGPSDLQLEVLFCGVCHSDLHQVRDEWHDTMPTVYPCVPGHEIVGRVTRTGTTVRRFREGDVAAVGCLVDSCRACAACRSGQEQFCEATPTFTYNAPDAHLGGVTYGGYSKSLVVDESFALRLSNKLDPAGAAPLLCAGITTWSPLRHWGVRRGQKVGVVGLGGLGHMAVKLANAMGARVVVFTRTSAKAADAFRLGAQDLVITTDAAQRQKHAASFDFILDTVSAPHDLNACVELLKRDGTLTVVGASPAPQPIGAFGLIMGRRRLAGSLIGGIRETQQMLDFCAERGITADIETIPIQSINDAFARMLRGDVKNRFVIDMASLN